MAPGPGGEASGGVRPRVPKTTPALLSLLGTPPPRPDDDRGAAPDSASSSVGAPRRSPRCERRGRGRRGRVPGCAKRPEWSLGPRTEVPHPPDVADGARRRAGSPWASPAPCGRARRVAVARKRSWPRAPGLSLECSRARACPVRVTHASRLSRDGLGPERPDRAARSNKRRRAGLTADLEGTRPHEQGSGPPRVDST